MGQLHNVTTKIKKLGRSEKARLNSTRVRAKSGETPENKTNGISTYNELVDQWSLFQSNKHLYVACSNICTLVCRLLKHLRPGSRFLIGKKCAWSLDHLFKSSWSLHFFYRSKVELELCVLDPLIFVVWRWPWSLDWLSKRALITQFNFDPGRKRFYVGYISDYPLKQPPLQYKNVSYSIEEESGNKAS